MCSSPASDRIRQISAFYVSPIFHSFIAVDNVENVRIVYVIDAYRQRHTNNACCVPMNGTRFVFVYSTIEYIFQRSSTTTTWSKTDVSVCERLFWISQIIISSRRWRINVIFAISCTHRTAHFKLCRLLVRWCSCQCTRDRYVRKLFQTKAIDYLRRWHRFDSQSRLV